MRFSRDTAKSQPFHSAAQFSTQRPFHGPVLPHAQQVMRTTHQNVFRLPTTAHFRIFPHPRLELTSFPLLLPKNTPLSIPQSASGK